MLHRHNVSESSLAREPIKNLSILTARNSFNVQPAGLSRNRAVSHEVAVCKISEVDTVYRCLRPPERKHPEAAHVPHVPAGRRPDPQSLSAEIHTNHLCISAGPEQGRGIFRSLKARPFNSSLTMQDLAVSGHHPTKLAEWRRAYYHFWDVPTR